MISQGYCGAPDVHNQRIREPLAELPQVQTSSEGKTIHRAVSEPW